MPGHRWLVLAAMAGSASMIMLDQTVVAVALAVMTRDEGLSPTGQQWVVNAYGLAVASLVAFGGKLADRFGCVSTFRVGVWTFLLGSIGCGLAPNGGVAEAWLIAARALEGVGAALMIPVSAALVVNAFSVATRGRAMAVYSGISQVFLALGPIIGGLLTQHVSWRAVFWLNVPIGIAALLLLRRADPADPRSPEAAVQARPAIVLVTGLALTVLALQQASRWGATAPATLGVLVVGLVLTGWFVRSQVRATTPLLDLRLLLRRAFLGNVVVLGLFQFALLAVVVFGSLYLQDVLGLSPSVAGVSVLAFVLPIMISAQLGGWWYDRSGVRAPVLAGLALTVVGLLWWAVELPGISFPAQLPAMVVTGFGLGLSASPCYTDALGRVAADRRGQASGVIQTVRQLGGILGVVMIGSVVLAIAHGGIGTADTDVAARAIATGFGIAAAVFGIAIVVGAVLLPRSRVTDAPTGVHVAGRAAQPKR